MKIRQPPPPTTTIVSIRLPPSPPQPPPPPLWYPPFFHHALHRHRHRFHGTEPREESENQGDKGLGRVKVIDGKILMIPTPTRSAKKGDLVAQRINGTSAQI
ncbi:unnamed protein product [Brassica oleracea var. botrytis]